MPSLKLSSLACVLLPALLISPDANANFRVRTDFKAPLNSDVGWAAAMNENASVFADQPFRLRFESEPPTASSAPTELRLQYRRNGGSWTELEAHDFPHPESEQAKTPRVSIVACGAYPQGTATTDLLRGSQAPFQPGTGISLAPRATTTAQPGTHSEFEWALVIRRFADGAETNEPGDTFDFRLVGPDGTTSVSATQPSLRLAVRPGHVGGTFVETPGRIGPWRASNGDLYFILEPAETSNLFLMIKSTDHGRTWREVDGAHRPPTRDLESVDARQVGDTIHILHQVTRSARYHAFRTADHRTQPDTWAVGGEVVGTVQSVAQAATLAVRGDGSLAAFYVGQTKIHVSVRSASGSWREVAVIDAAVGPQCVLGANDAVHLAYYKPDGSIWYQRLRRDNTLSPAVQLASGLATTRAEFGSVLPLIYSAEKNTAVILYRQRDGKLWERRIVNDAAPTPARQVTDRSVIQSAVDSQQPAADMVLDGDVLHVLFVEQSSRSIFSTHDRGGWQPSTLRVDQILGSWVRGNVYTRRDGVKVLGFIYDAGSDGGAGMNRFGEVELR